jgi:hypothetical protein
LGYSGTPLDKEEIDDNFFNNEINGFHKAERFLGIALDWIGLGISSLIHSTGKGTSTVIQLIIVEVRDLSPHLHPNILGLPAPALIPSHHLSTGVAKEDEECSCHNHKGKEEKIKRNITILVWQRPSSSWTDINNQDQHQDQLFSLPPEITIPHSFRRTISTSLQTQYRLHGCAIYPHQDNEIK